MAFTVGLDWGATGHAVGVLDDHGAVIVRLDCPHTRAGPADLLAKSKRVAAPAELPVAIERPSGLLVETLLAAGHPIVPIHPNVVKACRPRHRAAGGKSDPGDAYMLADILRTDGHRFAPLRPISDEIKALLGRDQGSARARPRPRRSGRRPRAARQPVAQSDRRLRARLPTEDQLAAEAGVGPVSPTSGKSRAVVFRWACHHRRRAAVTCFADNSRHSSAWAAAVFSRALHASA